MIDQLSSPLIHKGSGHDTTAHILIVTPSEHREKSVRIMRMHPRHMVAAVAFLAAFCLAHSTAFAAERPKRLTPEEKFLRDAPGRLAGRLFGRSDAKECAGYLKRADDESKPKFALIYARYLRAMEKEPIETLEFLGPWVMEKDKVRDWERAQKDAAKEAYSKWREEYRAADRDQRDALKDRKPGDDDEALFAPSPSPTRGRSISRTPTSPSRSPAATWT